MTALGTTHAGHAGAVILFILAAILLFLSKLFPPLLLKAIVPDHA